MLCAAVANGCYKVQVLVSENELTATSGPRTFNIVANGRQIASSYNILKYSPACTVNSISWIDTVSLHELDLQFGAVGAAPAIFNGILVTPSTCPEPYAEGLRGANLQQNRSSDVRRDGDDD